MNDEPEGRVPGKNPVVDSLESITGPLPWPKAEDRLVAADAQDWQNTAVLHQRWGDPWAIYADGYREAADLIVQRIKEGHRSQDLLVYPVMFLYRQYLELAIKSLIRKAWKLLDEKQNDDLGSHDLIRYWNMCVPLLERISPGDSTEELGHIRRLIQEFCEHDPLSFAFRYPESKTDKKSGRRVPTLPNLERLNLRNVQEVMLNAASLLGAAEMQIDDHLQTKADMEAEFRPSRGDFY